MNIVSSSSFSSTSFFSLAFFPSLPTPSLLLLLLLVPRSFLFLWPPLCFLYSLITVSPVVCLRSSSLRLSAPFPHAPRSPRDRDTEGNARRAVKVIDITIFPASEPTPLSGLASRKRRIVGEWWHAGARRRGAAEGGRPIKVSSTSGTQVGEKRLR